MKSVLVGVCGLLLTGFLHAAEITVDPTLKSEVVVSCQKPITREDGTVLAENEVGVIKFYGGAASRAYDEVLEELQCQTVIDISAKPEGAYFYAITASDVDGRESAYSEEFTINVKRLPPPSPVTGITLEAR